MKAKSDEDEDVDNCAFLSFSLRNSGARRNVVVFDCSSLSSSDIEQFHMVVCIVQKCIVLNCDGIFHVMVGVSVF